MLFFRRKKKEKEKEPEAQKLTHYGATSARSYDLICMGCGKHRFGRAMEIGMGVWKQLLPRINDKRLRPMFEIFTDEGSDALIGACPICQKVYDPIKFMFRLSEGMESEDQLGEEGPNVIPLGEVIRKMMQQQGEKEDDRSAGETEKFEQGDSERFCEHGESGPGHDPEREM